MERTPRLLTAAAPADPSGLVLLLHGGAAKRGNPMVSPAQLSVLRMIPIAKRIMRAGRGRLGVFRLLNTHRGWDSTHTPVDDVAWALAQRESRYAGRPVCLIGHSLGGRAALLAGSAPGVVSVVALNPWVYPTDDADLSGRRVLIIHGTDDRVASIERSSSVARRLAQTADVTFRTVEGGRHAMLRQGTEFERPAAEFVVETLVG
jgi:alpha-beta hydrolase superfamily lysophospholipase